MARRIRESVSLPCAHLIGPFHFAVRGMRPRKFSLPISGDFFSGAGDELYSLKK